MNLLWMSRWGATYMWVNTHLPQELAVLLTQNIGKEDAHFRFSCNSPCNLVLSFVVLLLERTFWRDVISRVKFVCWYRHVAKFASPSRKSRYNMFQTICRTATKPRA